MSPSKRSYQSTENRPAATARETGQRPTRRCSSTALHYSVHWTHWQSLTSRTPVANRVARPGIDYIHVDAPAARRRASQGEEHVCLLCWRISARRPLPRKPCKPWPNFHVNHVSGPRLVSSIVRKRYNVIPGFRDGELIDVAPFPPPAPSFRYIAQARIFISVYLPPTAVVAGRAAHGGDASSHMRVLHASIADESTAHTTSDGGLGACQSAVLLVVSASPRGDCRLRARSPEGIIPDPAPEASVWPNPSTLCHSCIFMREASCTSRPSMSVAGEIEKTGPIRRRSTD